MKMCRFLEDFPLSFLTDLKSTSSLQIFLRIFTLRTTTKIIFIFMDYFKNNKDLETKKKNTSTYRDEMTI